MLMVVLIKQSNCGAQADDEVPSWDPGADEGVDQADDQVASPDPGADEGADQVATLEISCDSSWA